MTTATLTRFPPAQLRVIALVALGLSNRQIADELGVKFGTVKDLIARSLANTGAGERAGLVALACRAGQLQHVPPQAAGPVVLPAHLAAVLGGIADGLPNKLIARRLRRPESTVKTWVKVLLRLLGARDRAHAVLIGWQLRILPEAAGIEREARVCPVSRRPAASERPAGSRWARGATPGSAGRYGAAEGFEVSR